MVAGQKDAETTNADEDPYNLCRVIPNMQKEKGYGYHYYNCPEIDELGRQYGRLSPEH